MKGMQARTGLARGFVGDIGIAQAIVKSLELARERELPLTRHRIQVVKGFLSQHWPFSGGLVPSCAGAAAGSLRRGGSKRQHLTEAKDQGDRRFRGPVWLDYTWYNTLGADCLSCPDAAVCYGVRSLHLFRALRPC